MSSEFVVWVSDSPTVDTGQSRVTREFCSRFKRDGTIPTIVGFHHDSCKTSDGDFGVVYEAKKDHALPQQLDWLMSNSPAGVIFSHDCWVFPYIPILQQKYPEIPIIGYFTVDGDPVHQSWVSICDACHAIVSPSDYGAKTLQRAGLSSPTYVVPYGVDHSVFNRQFGSRDDYLRDCSHFEIFGVSIPSSAFVVLSVGMNTSRKRLDLLVKSFSQLPVDDSYLILVTKSEMYYPQAASGIRGEYDLPTLIRESGCSERIILIENSRVNDTSLSKLYNLADVLVLPSEGEGFGLTLVESMACGTVPVTTNYTSGPEIVGECGYLVDIDHYNLGSWGVRRAAISTKHLSSVLARAFMSRSTSEYRERQRRCTSLARQYSWEKSYQGMLQVLGDVRKSIFSPDLMVQVV